MGMPWVFGIPGSGASLELLDGLERRGVAFHLCHFEGAAAMMAATAGRLTGKAGVAVSIKGPGLANMIPGLAVSYFEAFPLVAVSEAYPPDAPSANVHKRLHHDRLVSALVKGQRVHSDNGPGFADMASWAQEEEPGPVLLELCSGADPAQDPLPAAAPPPADPVGAVVKRIQVARRPVVVAGAFAVRGGYGTALSSLRVPVFTTVAAKGLVDERCPPAAGIFTGVDGRLAPERVILPEADLVVGLGLNPKELLKTAAFDVPVVDIGAGTPFGVEAMGLEMRTGADGMVAVLDALKEHNWGLEEARAAVDRIRGRLMRRGFLPAAVFDAIAGRFEHRVRLVMDTGSFCTIGEHVWQAPSPDLCLLSAQGRYMGTGVPMGIAASLADPRVPTVAVVGDGGIGPFLAEMRLAAAARSPLLLVLMTDGAFASVRTRAIQEGLTQRPLTMTGGSWVPVLEGLDVPGNRITDFDALGDALAKWNPVNGPAFLEIPFDPDEYEAMVHDVR